MHLIYLICIVHHKIQQIIQIHTYCATIIAISITLLGILWICR